MTTNIYNDIVQNDEVISKFIKNYKDLDTLKIFAK